jgi:hypothetical protein
MIVRDYDGEGSEFSFGLYGAEFKSRILGNLFVQFS